MSTLTIPKIPPGTALKAAVIYDDFEMAEEAGRLIERVAHLAGESIAWQIHPLPVHALQPAASGDDARLEAADAQWMVLALRDAVWLPPWLTEWLEGWAACRQKADAAIVTLGAGWHSHLSTPTLKKLRRLAHEWGLTCFCDGGAEGGDAVAEYFSTHPSAAWPTPWLPQSSERFTQLRDWGINE